MPRQEFTGKQIKDGSILKKDLNINSPGNAIITKIIAGSGITIPSYTGIDPGTGDVTIEAFTDPALIIDDGIESPSFCWSSYKITEEINNISMSVIDDNIISSSFCWSSQKIHEEINNVYNDLTLNLDIHASNLSIHRVLDDGLTTDTNMWSATKIRNEIDNAAFQYTPILSNLESSGTKVELNIQHNNVGIGACMGIDSDPTSTFLIESGADSTSLIILCRFLSIETGTGNKTVLINGFIRNDSWNFTPGNILYSSIIPGEITETAPTDQGQYIQMLGYAYSQTIIYFNPDSTYLTIH